MSKSLSVLSFTVALAATLTACGGGGGTAAPAPATPTPPPSGASVTLTGIAARGAALAGATVDVKCAGGNGTPAITSAAGAYSVSIAGASLPCAFKVTGTDGTVLHSLRAGTENTGSFNVNITPLTELVVARAASVAPASFFSAYASATAPSAAVVTDAISAVRTATAGVVDLSGVNPITDTLVAASAGTAGNALDQKIDALVAGLTAAQTTLAAVSSALVSNTGTVAPVATLLQPATTNCAALRSGRFHTISPGEADPLARVGRLDWNSQNLTATFGDNSTATYVDQGGCKFRSESAQWIDTAVVSSAGLVINQSQSKTVPSEVYVSVALPAQTLPVADFAGSWNVAIWQSASGTAQNDVYAETLEITFNASGAITSLLACEGLAACVSEPNPATLTVNATDGGFNITDQGSVIGRFFLFKNAAGQPVFVGVLNDDGSVLVGTPKRALGALPALGAVSEFRELSLRGNDTVDLWIDQSTTVTAVDTATRTVTRLRASDSRVDMIGYDKPRDGLRYRAANSCTTNGAPSGCAQTAQIPLQGMGVTLSVSVGRTMPAAQSFFNISVGKPGN
ncbi:MAG: hypothetical protein Q8K45_08915 [Rubrivivax sp.]|nr:hypothetical protein [Rubrivivax sp.]